MLNNIVLMGRVVADPEINYGRGEQSSPICQYRLAVERDRKDKGGEKQVDFIPCVCFGGSAEFASKYIRKGWTVVIQGRLSIQNYEKDGERRSWTSVIIQSQYPIFPKREKQEQGGNAIPEEDANGFTPMEGEDPFANLT